uniref:Uncharacterized protein n=1 Tax=Plectus sambesii TaxID=2011161 RepID=A0A914X8D7_9BILA
MTEEHSRSDLDDVTYKTACLITQQASLDMGFTALGFFVVSKETLLALFSGPWQFTDLDSSPTRAFHRPYNSPTGQFTDQFY